MKVTLIESEIGKGGGAFPRIAYHLTQEFAKKGLETALVTGRVIDLPHESTEIHLVCPKLIEKTAKTSAMLSIGSKIPVLGLPPKIVANMGTISMPTPATPVLAMPTKSAHNSTQNHCCVLSSKDSNIEIKAG